MRIEDAWRDFRAVVEDNPGAFPTLANLVPRSATPIQLPVYTWVGGKNFVQAVRYPIYKFSPEPHRDYLSVLAREVETTLRYGIAEVAPDGTHYCGGLKQFGWEPHEAQLFWLRSPIKKTWENTCEACREYGVVGEYFCEFTIGPRVDFPDE